MVANNNLPLRFCASEELAELCEFLNPGSSACLPSVYQLRENIIPEFANEKRRALCAAASAAAAALLPRAPFVASTSAPFVAAPAAEAVSAPVPRAPAACAFDSWTSPSGCGILGTVFFISADWKLECNLGGIVELPEHHTAAEISKTHTRSSSSSPQLPTTAVNPKAAELLFEGKRPTTPALDVLKSGPDYYKCLIHVVQLAVHEIYDSLPSLGRVHLTAKFFHNSPTAAKHLARVVREMRQAGTIPTNSTCSKTILMTKTRWASVQSSVDRHLLLRPAIDKVLPEHDRGNLILDGSKVQALREVSKLLTPVNEATRDLERRGCALAEALPLLVTMLVKMDAAFPAGQEAVVAVRNARETFIHSLLKRLKPIVADLIFVTLFDPRFKKLAFLGKTVQHTTFAELWHKEVEAAKKRLQDEYAGTLQLHSAAFQQQKQPAFASTKLRDTLLAMCDGQVEKTELMAYIDAYVDLEKHATDPLGWWRENASHFPTMALLARKYLAIPASTAEVERLFSAAKLVVPELRNRLAPDVLEDLLTIRLGKTQKD